ncbi:MAG: flagellar biosynthesis protein FlhF [Oscillospiraceae bacterium]|jgi:flagellar biosynthesis protein FlhF|nr:flagellar biosynthesis protein FlhF [Oscillospiraceae bacterium]
MLVKRYVARDMHEAMTTIIRELGADSVILNNRKIRQKGFFGLFKKRHIELMVAYDPEKVPSVLKFRENFEPSAPKPEKETQEVLYNQDQIELLTRRLDDLDGMLKGFVDKFNFVKRDVTYDYPEEVAELFCNLLENQVREELAHSIAKETVAILRHQPNASPTEIMSHLIMEQLGTPSIVQHKKFSQKVVLVVGPTGVGKTTSIVKLAANFVMSKQKKVGIINTDTYRIAAQEQMQTYADILEIPLQVVYKPDELTAALESMADLDVIFIDTAGKQTGEARHCEEVRQIIELTHPEDILLCISASISFPSAKEVLDSYSFLPDYKLVVTKLDETRYRGMIINLSWYSKKPLSYVTTGQNVPNDIEVLNTETAAKQILGLEPRFTPEPPAPAEKPVKRTNSKETPSVKRTAAAKQMASTGTTVVTK